MRSCAKGLAALMLVPALNPAAALAEKVDATIAIGSSATVWSETLREERRLLIYLPPHYAQSGKSYPVLYLLDAEAQFHQATGVVQFLSVNNDRIPEMIVIGITNTHRERDLTPPALDAGQRKDTPAGGGADDFLRFVALELVPWVESRYRTVRYRILVGHSYGGLFNLHVIANQPQLFQAHIATSPAMWWDRLAVVGRASAALRVLSKPPALFLSWGDNEPDIRDSTQALVTALESPPPPALHWDHRYYAGEDHMSMPLRSLHEGLEWLYAGWRMPIWKDDEEAPLTLPEVQAHYDALSARFGYTVQPSPAAIHSVARSLLTNGKVEAALGLLRQSVRDYPYLAEEQAQLGEALEKAGRRQEALLAYQRALRLAVEDENPYGNPVDRYREKLLTLQ